MYIRQAIKQDANNVVGKNSVRTVPYATRQNDWAFTKCINL